TVVHRRRGAWPGERRQRNQQRTDREHSTSQPHIHGSHHCARSANRCAVNGAVTPPVISRNPASHTPTAMSSGSATHPYNGTWISPNSRLVTTTAAAT